MHVVKSVANIIVGIYVILLTEIFQPTDNFQLNKAGAFFCYPRECASNDSSTTYLLQTETALTFDAVHLFARALTDLDRSQNVAIEGLSCSGTQTWQHGNSLVNYMKLVSLACW